jgi:8-oxo-dGTP pyrophosphatase MutT (NUDIX family)
MEKLRDVTLLFLVKRSKGKITEICLGLKKRGFGVGRWNGVGGKLEKDESIEDGAKRETKEEISVTVKKIEKVAELSFYFIHKPEWDQLVHVFVADKWEGEPTESEEMKPKWFAVADLPFDDMWPDDIFWLPEMLKGHFIRGMFTFEENDVIEDKKVDIVDKL